ncbi:MAG TPA: DsbC family protein [Dokdonella sp.]|jgi:thiol:disulfide interchange protein DsbC|nr:DsbC family protein [Dokdonella sp.]
MTVLQALGVVFFGLFLGQANAAEGDAARAAIQKVAPLQQISAFRKSALPGYYEGVIAGQVAYASADGRYLLRGTVEDVEQGVSLSEASMASRRREKLATLDSSMRLSFAPAQPKYRLTVFTDVDCPFCRRLHSRIDEYNALGIAIDYVFFPLSIHPGADLKSVAIWCSADRRQAYTAALRGQSPGSLHCPNPLAQMRQAGSDIGVVQTPTAIAGDGSVIDATVLMSPQRLVAELKKISEKADPSALAASAAGR